MSLAELPASVAAAGRLTGSWYVWRVARTSARR
jgi:hypothetical protein